MSKEGLLPLVKNLPRSVRTLTQAGLVLGAAGLAACGGVKGETQTKSPGPPPAQTAGETLKPSPTPETSSIQITPGPTETPKPTPEVYKYQESINLLNQVREFFNAENPKTQERLAEYNIEMGPLGDYRARRERVMPLLEEIQDAFKKEDSEKAGAKIVTLHSFLISPLKTKDGGRENYVIFPDEAKRLDPKNRFFAGLTSKGILASSFLKPGLEKNIQAWNLLELVR